MIINIDTVSRLMFAIDGIINTSMYIPQIIKAWRTPSGSSLWTWGFWTLTSADGLFYAIVAAKNIELALVLGGNVIGCGSVFLIAKIRETTGQPVEK